MAAAWYKSGKLFAGVIQARSMQLIRNSTRAAENFIMCQSNLMVAVLIGIFDCFWAGVEIEPIRFVDRCLSLRFAISQHRIISAVSGFHWLDPMYAP